jgi:[NiFe] hydrogenase assembly HybE family chaperone
MAEAPASAAPRPGPARGIEQAFARAAERMRGLPVCNPALRVEVVGLRAWRGEWLGAVVSPWTLSLFIVPGGGGAFRPLGADERQRWSFPSGEYDFLGGEDPALGPYQTCSLLSPPWELASQGDARAAAAAALDALLAVEPAPAPAPARGEARPVLSRRAFLSAGRGGAPR